MEMELMQVVAQYIRIELSIVIVALFVIGKFLKLTPNNGWMGIQSSIFERVAWSLPR